MENSFILSRKTFMHLCMFILYGVMLHLDGMCYAFSNAMWCNEWLFMQNEDGVYAIVEMYLGTPSVVGFLIRLLWGSDFKSLWNNNCPRQRVDWKGRSSSKSWWDNNCYRQRVNGGIKELMKGLSSSKSWWKDCRHQRVYGKWLSSSKSWWKGLLLSKSWWKGLSSSKSWWEMIVVIKELMGNDCRHQKVYGKDCRYQRVDGRTVVIKELMVK